MPGRDHCCLPQCLSDECEKEALVLFHTVPKDYNSYIGK